MNTSPGNCKCGETQYYKNANPVTCSPCHSSCYSCAWKGSTQCLTCADSSLTIASPPGSCSCATTQYIATSSPITCGNCDSSCATCSGGSVSDCLTCTDSAVTLSSTPSRCSCQTSQYTVSLSPLTCGNCDSSCATCSSSGSSNCLTCADSLITVASSPGSCTCSASKYIANQSPLSCGNCDASCATCSGPNDSDCLTCIDSAITLSSTPSKCSCENSQYTISQSPLSCGNCDSTCATCSGSGVSDCLTCSNSAITLSSTPSKCSCENSQYTISQSPLTCGSCDSSCATCSGSGASDCLTCSDSSVTLSSPPRSCSCNTSQYVIAKSPLSCENCDASCATCSGPSDSDCLTCTDFAVTLSSAPSKCSCGNSQYMISQSPLTCGNCDSSCATCSGSGVSDCLTCSDSSIAIASPPGKCSCNTSQYIIAQSPLTCGSCDSSCASCSDSLNSQCFTCTDSTITIANPPGSCMCLSNQFIVTKNPLSCAYCHSSCKTCSGSSINQCYTCTSSIRTPAIIPGSCICLQNQYIILDSPLTCGNCHASCATCLGPARDQCLTCSDSDSTPPTTPGVCECLSGQYSLYKNPTDCKNCDLSCSTCVGPNENQCLTCKNSTITLNSKPGKCFCDISQYVIAYSPLICGNCYSACLECSGPDAGDCLSCKNSSIISATNPGYCSCFDSEYIFSTSPLQCDRCHDSCETCSGSYFNDCLTCKNSTITPSEAYNQCICMQSEYIISVSPLTCGNCSEYCLSCSGPDEDQCILCKNSEIYTSINGYCYCKENEYIISLSPLICGVCDISCKTCVGPYENQCLSCSNVTLIEQPASCKNTGSSSSLPHLVLTFKNSGIIISAGLIISGFCESLITGKSGSLWTYVNIVQVLAFIPLQNIEIPDNLFQFWKAFLSYTYLHNTGKYIFGENKINELEPIESFYKYGYKSSSFLVNGSGMLLITVIVLVIWSLVFCLTFIPNPTIQEQIYKLLGKFKYNILLRLWIEIYILLMAAAVIGINHFSFQTDRTITDTILAYIFFLCGWIITFIITFLLYIIQFKVYKKSKKIKRKYGCLFREFKLNRRYIELLYYPVFLIRRLIFVINLYNLSWIPVIQWIINVFHSFCMVWLLCRYCRFKTKESQVLNTSGEALVTFSFLLSGPYLLDLPPILDKIIQCTVLGATYFYLMMSYYFLITKVYNLIKSKRRREKVYPELTINAAISENNDLITSGRLKEITIVPHNSLEGSICELDNENNYS